MPHDPVGDEALTVLVAEALALACDHASIEDGDGQEPCSPKQHLEDARYVLEAMRDGGYEVENVW